MSNKDNDNHYNVMITGRHVMITEAMKQYALEKISKLERITHKIIDIHVVMDIQKLDHRVDMTIRFDHIKIKVQAHSADMYSSVDKAVEKLKVQIRRYKDKITQHQTKSISTIDMNVNVIERGGVEEINDDIDSENTKQLVQDYDHKIVKHEIRPLKTLTQEESIMKMDLSGDSFMVYRAEEDNKLKVIYKREDGHFGVIEAE